MTTEKLPTRHQASAMVFLLYVLVLAALITAVVNLAKGPGTGDIVHVKGHTCIVWSSGYSHSISCNWTKP